MLLQCYVVNAFFYLLFWKHWLFVITACTQLIIVSWQMADEFEKYSLYKCFLWIHSHFLYFIAISAFKKRINTKPGSFLFKTSISSAVHSLWHEQLVIVTNRMVTNLDQQKENIQKFPEPNFPILNSMKWPLTSSLLQISVWYFVLWEYFLLTLHKCQQVLQ